MNLLLLFNLKKSSFVENDKKVMLRILTVTALMFLLNLNTNGQFNLSLGAEGVLMERKIKNIASHGVGCTIGADIDISQKSRFTLQTGFIYLFPIEKHPNHRILSMSPCQIGIKMYFNSKDIGTYFHPYIGVHRVREVIKGYSSISLTKTEETMSLNEASYGLGVGFISNKKIGFEVKYTQVARNQGTFNYLGLRISYMLL